MLILTFRIDFDNHELTGGMTPIQRTIVPYWKDAIGPTVPFFWGVVNFSGRNWCLYFDTSTNYGTDIPLEKILPEKKVQSSGQPYFLAGSNYNRKKLRSEKKGTVVWPRVEMKKYARGYLPSLPIFYVFSERGEYIKDTFGQARHRKLACRAGCTLCTPCSSVSCSHGSCSHRNHSF